LTGFQDRLQDISEAEAIAGGIAVEEVNDPRPRREAPTPLGSRAQPKPFGKCWDELYKKSDRVLADNPEVVSLAFSIHYCNVGSLRAQNHPDEKLLSKQNAK
jgi:hypothetical protein